MKLPRDISGTELARLLHRYGYRIVRLPAHSPLKVGTLSAILRDLAEHLDLDRERLAQELFDR